MRMKDKLKRDVKMKKKELIKTNENKKEKKA